MTEQDTATADGAPEAPGAIGAGTVIEDVAERAERPSTRGMRRKDLLRSTPGQWGVLLVALVIAGLIVGLVTSLSVRSRQQTLADLATSSGQLRVAAAEFHRSLSTADTAAAAAFLARDQNRATDRVRYETAYEAAISEAQSALATLVASRDEDSDPGRRNLLGTLPGRLSEYTVLIETARAYNRQGEPVASTYQLLAADAMRAHLLPAARELHQATRARVADKQLSAMSFPVLELVLIGLLLGALVGAQVWLRRRTNRLINVGLVAATAAAAAMLVWTMAGAVTAGAHAERSAEEGTQVGDALTDARITALAARGNEALLLVSARDDHDTSRYQQRFIDLRERLVGSGADDSGTGDPNAGDSARSGGELALAKAATDDAEIRDQIDKAAAAADVWLNQHDVILSAAGAAQAGAVEALLGSPGAGSFTTVDDALGAAVDDVRHDINDEITAARSAMTAMTTGVITLSGFIALAAGAGVWQRLREYR
ncbi:hypothetical protein [Haloechinothrix salitolerans]|uniref:Four helix bundle sensory module for signal transduction n=1 Tax=Haloechinothrix salitolerans TaxID=926830 RepID=A0ABW2C6B6_9PSEU